MSTVLALSISGLIPNGVPEAVLTALRKAPEARTDAERTRIAAHYRTLAPRYDHYTRRINAIRVRAIEGVTGEAHTVTVPLAVFRGREFGCRVTY